MGHEAGVMRLAVAGATGLIGAQVVRIATAAGHEVVVLSRSTASTSLIPTPSATGSTVWTPSST